MSTVYFQALAPRSQFSRGLSKVPTCCLQIQGLISGSYFAAIVGTTCTGQGNAVGFEP